jgi:hypothetical protein
MKIIWWVFPLKCKKYTTIEIPFEDIVTAKKKGLQKGKSWEF